MGILWPLYCYGENVVFLMQLQKVRNFGLDIMRSFWLTPTTVQITKRFGADSHEFNIDRLLEGKLDEKRGRTGIYANLMTFGHGPKSCIGH